MDEPTVRDLVYAQSEGFAMSPYGGGPPNPGVLDVGGRFMWRGVEWQLAGRFATPCCGFMVLLVRRFGGKLTTWSGIRCDCGCTYTVEKHIQKENERAV